MPVCLLNFSGDLNVNFSVIDQSSIFIVCYKNNFKKKSQDNSFKSNIYHKIEGEKYNFCSAFLYLSNGVSQDKLSFQLVWSKLKISSKFPVTHNHHGRTDTITDTIFLPCMISWNTSATNKAFINGYYHLA